MITKYLKFLALIIAYALYTCIYLAAIIGLSSLFGGAAGLWVFIGLAALTLPFFVIGIESGFIDRILKGFGISVEEY